MKFRAALPLLFKDAVAAFALAPVGVSKYRLCTEASIAGGGPAGADDAPRNGAGHA
jgi:hypothetical protein